MPNPRLVLACAKSLTLLVLLLLTTRTVHQVFSQATQLAPATDFAISALPAVSEEMPAISGNRVLWYDDRAGPTDVWVYDLTTAQTSALTSHQAAQFIADLDGDLVTYEDNRNGTWDIYARRGRQAEFPVVTGRHHQRYPRVWRDYIVYQDETADYAESNVYLYQVSTGVTTPLAVGAGFQGKPAIDNQWVVWLEHSPAVQLGIYNLATKAYSAHPVDCGIYDCAPRLSGDAVVWSDRRNGDADIYLYNLVTQTETAIYTGAGDQLYPDVSAELIAWQDEATYGNWNVFVYVRATQSLFPVTVEPSWQTRPAVAGNTVVWQDNRSHAWDIYGYTWRGVTPVEAFTTLPNPRNLQVGAYAQGAIQLTWEDASADEQGFIIERAVGVLSTAWQELAVVPANITSYRDTATVVGESYWYRVRATSAAGNSTFSNESYSTALDEVPNLDERYLHLLINELRMAPEAWQHSEYAPVNPVGWHPNLAYSARAHALGMNNSNCCQGHVDLAGRGPGERAAASDYVYGASENLAQASSGSSGMEGVHQLFIDSSDHLANLLDPNMRQLAIGFAPGGRGTLVEVFSSGPADAVVPALPSGMVVPYQDKVGSEFDFLVSFANPAQEPPSAATVVIDGVAHPMTLRSGQPGRGTYLYRTRLPLGEHTYAFAFTWGSPPVVARLPEQGTFAGPTVRPPMPDLQVNAWAASQTKVVAGREWQMPVDLTNAGETAATGVTVGLYRENPHPGSVPLAQVTLPKALPPGHTETVFLPWQPAQAGVQKLYLWVDSEATVRESNEANNLAAISVQVRAGTLTWYVNGAAAPGGDGLTPETALTSIPAALEQAFAGDFVRVAAGSYPGPIAVPDEVHLAGAGHTQTTVQGSGQGSVMFVGNGSAISGFTITGSGSEYWDAGVWINADAVATVRNNRITGNNMGIVQPCFDQACANGSLLLNNLIDGQRLSGINIHNAQVSIINNTVVGNNEWGVHVDVAGTVVKNNLIVGNKGIGLYSENPDVAVEYNNLWNNGRDFEGGNLGTGNLNVDPQWVAAEQGDYRLKNTSPCLNAGDPAAQYQDGDGSRNDMGAQGGPGQALPLPTITPTPTATVTPPPTLPGTPTPTNPGGELAVYLPVVQR